MTALYKIAGGFFFRLFIWVQIGQEAGSYPCQGLKP